MIERKIYQKLWRSPKMPMTLVRMNCLMMKQKNLLREKLTINLQKKKYCKSFEMSYLTLNYKTPKADFFTGAFKSLQLSEFLKQKSNFSLFSNFSTQVRRREVTKCNGL